ncbi:hypothetical protein F66182_13695, partial [Fusarium sp. NRRL 66182]
MRFSIAALALFAGASVAQITVTSVDIETITSCAPSVTNCPARSSATAPAAVTSGVSPVSIAPAPSKPVTSSAPAVPAPVSTSTTLSPVAPYPVSSASLSTSVITVTTCVPTT